MELDIVDSEVLAGSGSKTANKLDSSKDVGTESFGVPDPYWKEGTVENTGAADEKDGLEFTIAAVPLGHIELAGVPDSVVVGVTEREVDEGVPSEPLFGVGGAVEAPKENKAGAVDIDNLDETCPNDLTRSPAFCVSPALIKLDPSVRVEVASLVNNFNSDPVPASTFTPAVSLTPTVVDETANILAALGPELNNAVCSF